MKHYVTKLTGGILSVILLAAIVAVPVLCETAATPLSDNVLLRDGSMEALTPPTEALIYQAEMKSWNPEAFRPEDFGIQADRQEHKDSYGGTAYIWKNDDGELFVTDYGYAGYTSKEAQQLLDAIMWSEGIENIAQNTADLTEFQEAQAEGMATAFLQMFDIENFICLEKYAVHQEDVKAVIQQMQSEGY